LKFICGDLCEKSISNDFKGENPNLEGALRSIDNFKVFTVLGTLEYFDNYLEMLECAYPSIRGIVKVYKAQNFIENKNSKKVVVKTDALARLLNETCANNLYVPVYNKILSRSLSRYDFMMKKGGSRGMCCRKPKNQPKNKPPPKNKANKRNE